MDQETIDKIKFRHVTWADFDYYCHDIYIQMLAKKYKPECIIGLLRGGIIPARIFSDYFDISLDFFALDVKLYDGINKAKERPVLGPFSLEAIRGKRILITDDILDSGRTMNAVLEYLKGEDVTTATLFWKETAERKPDYYSEIARKNTWINFPWEHFELERELHGRK